jgi:hypothetical protein
MCNKLKANSILDISEIFMVVAKKDTTFWDVTLLSACVLGLLFNPEDEDSMFLRNVGSFYQTTVVT